MAASQITPDGRARVGDCVRTAWGDELEIVAIMDGNDVPSSGYTRSTTAGDCALYGGTDGYEKQRIERWRKRQRDRAAQLTVSA